MHTLTLLVLTLVACGSPKLGDDSGLTTLDDTNDTQPTTDITLFINEFMASNSAWVFDESDPEDPWTPDWIEIYNPADVSVDLEDFTISDDLEEPDKHTLGDLSVPAGGFLLLYADGDPELGDEHLGFKLNREEDAIGLFSPEGVPLDQITYTDQVTDYSAARIPNGGEFSLTADATPGASNPSEAP
ncbi:MAG: lamin tail domain-containing protein [Alphaproteobacteria bacterium]|nr:lamin tail domain-containing protein [Alphaproteobacteria bacterium]